jgi:Holliday junction DNA helicase RuvB
MHQIQRHFLAPERLARVHDYTPGDALRELRATEQRGGRAAKTPPPRALSFDERSGNELRPATFDQMVGQERLRALLRRIVDTARATGRPLDHVLLTGQAGTGKTTLGQVIAQESGRRCFQLKAPVTHAMLEQLRLTCIDGDVVVVDEIHQQVSGDRRGVTQAADPEDFYHLMEDRRLPVGATMLPFPVITLIGCTTDAGLLPEAFISRFPLSLTLDPYTFEDMHRLALANARALGCRISREAAAIFARASRRHPRTLNTYVKNAKSLGATVIGVGDALEVVRELNATTLDGLTLEMVRMLRFLLQSRRENARGEIVYQASVGSIATALGHSRDTKAVALYVEPYLIEQGLVQVTHGGRTLTPAGITRALELAR